MVEAALVLPIMIVIVIGIIEMGLLFTSFSTATASTRSGARLAATNYATATRSPSGSLTGQQRSAADQIALSTSADLKVLNNARPIGMAIYKVNPASADGAPYGGFPGANMTGGCNAASCIKYTWDTSTKTMQYVSGSWYNPEACVSASVDSIGVFVEVEHDYITGFFGTKRTVTGHTVMRIEPLPSDACGA